jgi:hypothetical protein
MTIQAIQLGARICGLWVLLIGLLTAPISEAAFHADDAAPSLFPSVESHRSDQKQLAYLSLDVRLGMVVHSAPLARMATASRPMPWRMGVQVGPELSLGSGAWAVEIWPRFQYQEIGDYYQKVYGFGLYSGALHRWVMGWHVVSLGIGAQGGFMAGSMVALASEGYLRVPFRWAYYPSKQLGVLIEAAPVAGMLWMLPRRLLTFGETGSNVAADVTLGGELSLGLCFP